MNPITHAFPVPATFPNSETPGRLSKAAREFEGQLLFSLLHSLEKSFSTLSAGFDEGGQQSGYSDMGTEALATALSNAGGIGIAKLLVRQFDRTKVLP